MTLAELKETLGMNSRVGKVKCMRCGKELAAPNMYGDELKLLKPYCCAATVLIVQWLIHHGWHCLTLEATPPGAFLCPDCYNGQPEYHKSQNGDAWCEQAEKWMKENNGIHD